MHGMYKNNEIMLQKEHPGILQSPERQGSCTKGKL